VADLSKRNQEIQEKLSLKIKDGVGIAFLEQGDIFSGQWKGGLRDGIGYCKFKDGAYYKGEWVNDRVCGQGILALPEKDLVISGKFKDRGLIFQDQTYQVLQRKGDFYEGRLTRDLKYTGKGKLYFRNGDYYEGDFVEGKREGRGKLTLRGSSGSQYTGQFKEDQAWGEGLFLDAHGNSFQTTPTKGFFYNRMLHGHGKAKFCNDDVYVGEFKDGSPSGEGEMSYQNIESMVVEGMVGDEGKYVGSWKMGRKEGFGVMTWGSDKAEYRGIWKQDLRVHGKMTLSDTLIYKGPFVNE